MPLQIKSVMLRFDKFLHETDKAILIRIHDQEHWLPKKLCRNFVTNKKLGGNVTVPAFLYERITGITHDDIPIGDADTIIEHHVPDKVEPVINVESLNELSK